MKEPQALNDVAEFHKTFGAPIEKEPIIPSPERCELRLNLLKEELKELEEAINDNDIVEIADALSDIQYVLSGAILEFGMGEKFADLFSEVQRSNMSKVCKTLEEAEATVAHYAKLNQEGEIKKRGEYYVVYRKSDNKVLKSVNYSEAQLKEVLDR